MANEKKINELVAQSNAKIAQTGKVPTERLRTAAQGLTLGFADELEAYTIARMTGRPVEEILGEIRGNLKAYQEAYPNEAMALELGGAVAPMLFTGGGAAIPTAGRLAMRGAAEGAAYAYGTGEGGVEERLARVPSGAAFGAGGGVVGGKLAQYGIQGLESLVDAARRTTGRRGATVVENEIQRLVEQTGKTPDQIVQDIVDGKILAENRTIAAAVKALRGQGGPAAETIQTALEQRPRKLRSAAEREIASYLSDADPSVTVARDVATSQAKTAAAETAAYDKFKNVLVSNDVYLALSDALESVPEAGNVLLEIARREKVKGLYRIGENGEVIFARKPTISEAERIRRVINNRARKESVDVDFELGKATKAVESELRSALDVDVPDLMSTRAQAAAVRNNRDAFKAGEKALQGDVNKVMVDLEDKWVKDPATLASFRAGFLGALQEKFTTASERTILRRLLEEGQKEGMLLRTLIPDPKDQAAILRKIDIAVEGEDVAQTVLRNTQTAETMMARQAQNAGITAAEGVAAATGDLNALLSVTRKFVDSFSRDLTNAERKKIAELLVSENPELVKRAITDERAIAQAQQFIANIAPFVTKTGATFAGREASGLSAGLLGPVTQETYSGVKRGLGEALK